MTGYVHDILQSHVSPLMQRLTGAIFQQDNARPHTARVSQDCLPTVTTLPWPAQSPDLSPVEYIWDHLGWRVGSPLEFERTRGYSGCGSPEVKVSDHGRHVMSSSPVPLKTRRVGQRCTLNLSRAEMSSRWCGVVVRRGDASSGVVHVT
ncbi:transposable element Tcb2 transposase [Trichonephila clavipes]|nr:transposable element Tcb2 transposase [Trichonephila clavipes]